MLQDLLAPLGSSRSALDLRLPRRLAGADPVHLPARPASRARRAAPPRPAARGRRARDGPHTGRRPSAPSSCRSSWPALGAGAPARRALRDQRLRRRLDPALRLVHPRDLHLPTTSSFDRTAAAALGVVLVVLMLRPAVASSSRIRGARRYHRLGPGRRAPGASRARSGAGAGRRSAFCALVVLVALVLPVGGARLLGDARGSRPARTSLRARRRPGGNSLLPASAAAALRGGRRRSASRCSRSAFPAPLERARSSALGYAGYALPGIVVALALVFFGTRVALPLYQTLAMLVFALTIHYLPLAVGPISASLLQVSPRVEEAARGLGRGPLEVFRTITVPLVARRRARRRGARLPARDQGAAGDADPGADRLRDARHRHLDARPASASSRRARSRRSSCLLIAAPPLYLLSERGTVTS